MQDFQDLFTHMILPHWPFFAWLFTAMLIGQVMKTAVWTKERAAQKGKGQWLFYWAYKTLALHPVVSGALVGVAWREPEEGMTKLPACIAYFALAGACSVFAYEFLKAFAKKEGVDLALPGESKVPSNPPPAKLETPAPPSE